MKYISTFAVVALAACAQFPVDADRGALTSFRRDTADASGKTFIFEASAPTQYGAQDPAAERVRIAWLERWLNDNEACPRGYAIAARDAMKLGDRSDTQRISYVVRCHP